MLNVKPVTSRTYPKKKAEPFLWLSGKFNHCDVHGQVRHERRIFALYWTGNSMNNLLSYCGLVDAKIRASDIYYLPATTSILKCTFRNDFNPLWRAGTIPQLTDESHLCDLNDEAFRRLFCSLIKHDISLLVKLPTWHHKSPISVFTV